MKTVIRILALATAVLMGGGLLGCALVPAETRSEEARLEEAGRPYRAPFDQRALPELSADPSWREVLQRAFLANGELEAAYHEWAVAVRKISQDAAWPNANIELGFDYLFSDESLKSWNRTTLTAGFVNDGLVLPFKARQTGKVALANARAAGEQFYGKKFEVQKKVLQLWIDYALAAERFRTQQADVELLQLLVESARARVRAGGLQQDLIKAEVEQQRAENELKSSESELPQIRAMLNAMLARDPQADLSPATKIPGPRPIPSDDASIIAAAVESNPELAQLAHQVQGREDAVELARMMYIPDVSPIAAITGNVSQAVGAMIMLPSNLAAIHSEVDQMQSMLAASEAMLRQTRLDRAGEFVAALYALRNYERQAALFRERIVPATERVVALTRQSYANGGVGLTELIESQRTLLHAKLVLAEALAGREKRLAELETLAGVDIETLGDATYG